MTDLTRAEIEALRIEAHNNCQWRLMDLCDQARRLMDVLSQHHCFQKNIGRVTFPVTSIVASIQDGQCDIDLSARYAESELCRNTETLLQPPAALKPQEPGQ